MSEQEQRWMEEQLMMARMNTMEEGYHKTRTLLREERAEEQELSLKLNWRSLEDLQVHGF